MDCIVVVLGSDKSQPKSVIIGGDTPEARIKIKALFLGRYKYIDIIETNKNTALHIAGLNKSEEKVNFYTVKKYDS